MSKKGTVLHSAERNLLLKLMTFFEEEKKKRLAITPYSVEDIIVMKNIARTTNSSQADTSGPTDIELMLLENEKKYQIFFKSYDNIVKCTAAATGVSERTLRRIKVEAKKKIADQATSGTSDCSNVILSSPKKSKPPKKRLDIDDFMICSIRNIIEQYYKTNKEVPTLGKVLAQAKKDFNFPGQKNTLWKIITTKLGYSFKKRKNVEQFLIQKPEIATWRAGSDSEFMEDTRISDSDCLEICSVEMMSNVDE